MGTIYRNGVPFVGSGGAGGVEMTQAEYDLLPTSEKMNGAIYFITDGDVSYPSASQMRYDNTESQIPATSVQGAIDENRIEINDLQSGLSDVNAYLTPFRTSSVFRSITLNSSAPYLFETGSYKAILMLGFAQGIGSVALVIKKGGSSVTVYDLFTGSAFSSNYLTFTVVSNGIRIESTLSSNSRFITVSEGS